MPPPSRRAGQLVLTGVVLLAGVGVLSLVLDWRELRHLAADAHWALTPAALGATALAYAALSYAFVLVNAIVGIGLPRRTLFAVGFVSIALGQFAAGGGITGHAVRLVLMRQRGASPGDVLAASLLHSSLTGLVLLALLPGGLGYLLLDHPLPARATAAIILAVGLLLAVVGLAAAVLFTRAVRRPVLAAIALGWRRLTGRTGLARVLDDLDAGLTRAVTRVRTRPLRLALPLGLIGADWALAALTLAVCFQALGTPVKPAVLLTGLAIGVAAGMVSMLPGGLGVQDGSMTGLYVLLGVPLEQAVLALILFRLVYYATPFAASIALYRHLEPSSSAR